MTAVNITPKQRRVLDFIQSYMGEHRCSPSVRDIMHGVGLKSTGNAFRYLIALEERGAIARPPSKARAIEIVRP